MDYEASGGISIGGATESCKSQCISCRFGPGSVVFMKTEAELGKLRKIYIKKVRVNSIPRMLSKKGGGLVCMYYDTHNEIYADIELVDYRTGLELAKEFYENQISAANYIIDNGLPSVQSPRGTPPISPDQIQS